MKNLIYLLAIGLFIMSCKKDDNISISKNNIIPVADCTTQTFRSPSDTTLYHDAKRHLDILEFVSHNTEPDLYTRGERQIFIYEGTYVVIPAGEDGYYNTALLNKITLEIKVSANSKRMIIYVVQFREENGPESSGSQRSEGYELKDINIENNYINFKIREICDEWTLRK